MMPLPDDFRFSQSNLQDYRDCARRFELRYLQELAWPALVSEPAQEHEQRMRQGAAFHRLVQRHLLGIPVNQLEAGLNDETLRRWWENYRQHGPADWPSRLLPETTLSASLGGYRLIATYDLLAIEPAKRALIVDWKTARHRPRREPLRRRLQSRVYPYVLARAGADRNNGQPIPPENITMLYWFADFPDQPERFDYHAEQFARDEADLLALIDEIQNRTTFPLTPNEQHCRFCAYRSLCDRGVHAADERDPLPEEGIDPDEADELPLTALDLEQIAEIDF